MELGAINLNILEIIILQCGAIVLGIAIHFLYNSQKRFEKEVGVSNLKPEPKKKEKKSFSFFERKQKKESSTGAKVFSNMDWMDEFPAKKIVPAKQKEDENILQLKQKLDKQQELLDKVLHKMEGESTTVHLGEENEELKNEIADLKTALAERDNEIKSLRQQDGVAEKMAQRLEEVHKEFDQLQQKILTLEKQAGNTTSLTLQLEEISDYNEQLKKDLLRKQEKLDELIAENQRMYHLLNETEDKLSEANLQRQQLQKKVQFLQDMNDDMSNISETNKRLQNELRRIGELESMLGMMEEERNRTSRKQS